MIADPVTQDQLMSQLSKIGKNEKKQTISPTLADFAK
jgi:hypothetical protein